MSGPGTRTAVRTAEQPEEIQADVCVVGAGIAGFAAATTLADLGRSVVLVDAMPVVGGQCVNSLIGLFCGVYGTGPDYPLLTRTVYEDLFADLEPSGALSWRYGETLCVQYDEVAVGRWMERQLADRDVTLALGSAVDAVDSEDGRVARVHLVSRHGRLTVRAGAYVDASGDASLTWLADLPCHVPDGPIYGSQQFRLGGVVEDAVPSKAEVSEALRRHGEEYGVVRREGIPFVFPGTGRAVINMTHVVTPLGTLASSRAQTDGRDQADRVAQFLREVFPDAFGDSRVLAYGVLGRRQTRWISGLHTLTDEDVAAGTRFEDAVARTAWPIELHDRPERHRWEVFDPGHLHYVPLRSMIPVGARNLVAAGRCVDGEPAALSSVRVMGPCAAMGAGAAHAVDLADGGDVSAVDLTALADRVRANVR
ncbi:FAD-dependent oxidoreductase [Georgenia alba]|uniref:FAD-dependent oxidoreductase n=1 Tax=Georgenia alba TaxID=2233858 RepID=A0ABW2Q6E7_9MICO